MKNQFLMLFILTISVGCSDSDTVETKLGNCLALKQVNSPTSYDLFKWNSDGKLIQIDHYLDNLLDYTSDYTYEGNSLLITNTDDASSLRYDFNDKGQLLREINTWESNKDTVLYTYTDDSKYFTGEYYYGFSANGKIRKYEWLDGNIVKVTYIKNNFQEGYILLEYDNMFNPFYEDIFTSTGFNFGAPYIYSKNNPVKTTWYPEDELTGSDPVIFSYQYNENGYPIEYDVNGIRNVSLEYQCD